MKRVCPMTPSGGRTREARPLVAGLVHAPSGGLTRAARPLVAGLVHAPSGGRTRAARPLVAGLVQRACEIQNRLQQRRTGRNHVFLIGK